jgi:hypothetical protein
MPLLSPLSRAMVLSTTHSSTLSTSTSSSSDCTQDGNLPPLGCTKPAIVSSNGRQQASASRTATSPLEITTNSTRRACFHSCVAAFCAAVNGFSGDGDGLDSGVASPEGAVWLWYRQLGITLRWMLSKRWKWSIRGRRRTARRTLTPARKTLTTAQLHPKRKQ